MCLPAAALLGISLATSIASTGLGYVMQSQAASAQAEHQNQVYAETARSANESFVRMQNDENARLLQEQAASADQASQLAGQRADAAGQASAILGERGVGGNSADALFRDFSTQYVSNLNNITTNYDWNALQSTRTRAGLQAQTQSRINQAVPGPVNTPSPFAAGLQLAGTALSAYDQFNWRNDRLNTLNPPPRS